jgi:hypothetical protein
MLWYLEPCTPSHLIFAQVKLCYICREEERYDSTVPVKHSQLPTETRCSTPGSPNKMDTPMQMHPRRPRILLAPLDQNPTA